MTGSETSNDDARTSEIASKLRQVGDSDAEEDGTAIASDSESVHEQIEVFFDDKDAQRRRASRTTDREHEHSLINKKHISSYFVHSLLERHCSQDLSTRRLEKSDEGVPQADVPSDKPADGPSHAANIHEQSSAQISNGHAEEQSHVHSRLLTKQQIRDMAFGIREMSQQLGHLRVMLKIRHVFLLTKAHDKKLIAKTREVTKWLLSQKNSEGHQYHVWVEKTMRHDGSFDGPSIVAQDASFKDHLHYWTNEICAQRPHTFDMCVALGGDGTVLYASWLFQKVVPPVMSFALGSLGFLTKFDFDDHANILTKAFNRGVTVSVRLRFEATVMRSSSNCAAGNDCTDHSERDLVEELIGCHSDDPHTHRPNGTRNILNDIVLDRGPSGTMTTIEVFGDDDHFTTVQADGICVATPTGSTAYNLAAGGSLCHPDNPVILVTAIAPHTLSFRPIILPDTMVLRLGVPYDARASCWASFDGKERTELKPGDYVTVSASRFPFPSILPLERSGEDWVRSISRTLNWNSRQRQKAFDEKSAD